MRLAKEATPLMAEPRFEGPHKFSPLMPNERALPGLSEIAGEIIRRSYQLVGQARPEVLASLRPLLRAMNSYYTNRIEGQHTLPAELERAIRQQFDDRPDIARRQRLAIAHMNAEERVEADVSGLDWSDLFGQDFLRMLHRQLFAPLAPGDLMLESGERLMPGEFRQAKVTIGKHVAPDPEAIPAYLAAWAEQYGQYKAGERALIAAACSHHRLAWVHPFSDGNGRVARLHTHALLAKLGLTSGIWSPLRGFARRQQEHYARLANADSVRRGDHDGRGNLSEQGLTEWARFVLDVCLDQVTFMTDLLALDGMKERIRALVAFESQRAGSRLKPEAAVALQHVFLTGAIDRGEFKQLTGLAARTAERVLKECLDRELLVSFSLKGPVRLGTPLWALRWLFPRLWPEAEAATV